MNIIKIQEYSYLSSMKLKMTIYFTISVNATTTFIIQTTETKALSSLVLVDKYGQGIIQQQVQLKNAKIFLKKHRRHYN